MPIYLTVDERLLIVASLRLVVADELIGSEDNSLVLHGEKESDGARAEIQEFRANVNMIDLAKKLGQGL
jgi:hypothetical protein